jgi:hypothetical protein
LTAGWQAMLAQQPQEAVACSDAGHATAAQPVNWIAAQPKQTKPHTPTSLPAAHNKPRPASPPLKPALNPPVAA